MNVLRDRHHPGVVGKLLADCRIPEIYFANPYYNAFDAIVEGLSLLVLVTEHKDTLLEAIKDDERVRESVIDELRELHAYTETVASEFRSLGDIIEELAAEAWDIR